ncbi:hypothetical protein GF389_05975 [Candidatus Dojkabacteria bacterium]|nr:hypothetical protein [Candidatus Dojkabacteria bacterium]
MKNLFIGTSPNIQKDDLWLVTRLLFQPWRWKSEKPVRQFEEKMEEYLQADVKAFAFDSARTSFYQLLKSWGIGEGDEVLVPTFTCVVVINPILRVGATPVYVDTDPRSFNMDLEDLRKKFTSKTKAVLAQHTFGVPVDVGEIRKVVGKDVKIVEDLAHYLHPDAKSKNSDAAILTFGIEKMMTSLRGGMAVVGAGDDDLRSKLQKVQENAKSFGLWRIFKWLINPIVWSVATPTYFWGFGKFTIGRLISQFGHMLGMMGNMMEGCEYRGCFPDWMPARMPGALAQVGMNQLDKLDELNEHRAKIAKVYDEVLLENRSELKNYYPLRYPIMVDDPRELKSKLREKHVIIGNWYEKVLFTDPQYLDELKLDISDIPNTMKITKQVINLPTFIKVSEEDAREIAENVKQYSL